MTLEHKTQIAKLTAELFAARDLADRVMEIFFDTHDPERRKRVSSAFDFALNQLRPAEDALIDALNRIVEEGR
jgi:hypothetical protein